VLEKPAFIPPLTGPIRPHRNPQRKRFKIGRIGRLNGRLTGPIFLRAVNQLHSLRFRSARSKDWLVNLGFCVLQKCTDKEVV
jgi:hypothetical protein